MKSNKETIMNSPKIKNGFTLMELLVVIAIMGMLAGILLPTLNKARERARRVVCKGNLEVIGEALSMYNIDHGSMPWSPPPGSCLATVKIKEVDYVPFSTSGLGFFYEGGYIDDFAVYLCPSSNYLRDPKELKKTWQADDVTFCTYIYRGTSGYELGEATLILSDARPAIVMDYNCLALNKYNHKGEYVNILFRNGYVKGVQNPPDPSIPADTLTISVETFPEIWDEATRAFPIADRYQ